MNSLKKIWNDLAKERAEYYILGSTVTPQEFRKTGETDYKKLILEDELVRNTYPHLNKTTILDLGCGTGRMTEFMAKDFGRVIGTDISGEMIGQAKTRLGKDKNIELYENDGEHFSFPDNSVDFVFSYWTYQHFKVKGMVAGSFKEVYRVLKPYKLFKTAVRSKKPIRKDYWWSGVQFDQDSARELYEPPGFVLVKQLYKPDDYTFWLWLIKTI
jgi:ubiquinone/menaquinone biosynthesis C-methylase UbiE